MAESHLDLDWSAYAEEIGRRVAAVRELRNVSQTELANVAGLSRSMLQNIERSRSSPKESDGNPSIRKLYEIAQALGVPVGVLLPGGVPRAEYRSTAEASWSELKVELADVVGRHPLPDAVRPSDRVS
ncbi:helix-turn-helix transcriptional regulator [Myceligenerans crystallogenes]|uniref:helix-turn-helix domain-containing protein n=1 Tax=Myceligenerans crystallogenes TaxID=316335 RepID=UPI0031CF1864